MIRLLHSNLAKQTDFLTKVNSLYYVPLINQFSKEIQPKKSKFHLPNFNDPELKHKIRVIKQLKQYVIPFLHSKPITNSILKAYGFLACSKLFFYSGPLCLKYGVNAVQSIDHLDKGALYFLAYGICYTSYVVFEGYRNRTLAHIQQTALKDITEKTYAHLLTLDPSYHFGESQRTKLYDIYRAQKAIEGNFRTVSNFFIPLFIDIILSSFYLFKFCGLEFFLSFGITYAAYTFFTIDLSNYRLFGMRSVKKLERQSDFTMSETLSNFYNVKYYNTDNFEINRFGKIQQKYSENAIENARTLAKLNSGQRVVFTFGLTANMLFGVLKIYKGLMTAGDIILVQSLMMQIFSPLFFLGVQYREWQDRSVDIKRLYEIWDMKPKIIEKPNAQQYQFKGGEIELNNISFSYSKENNVLQNISLKIPKGKWISLCGESGIGKTTILNLIFRLYDPKSGEVLLDGQNLQDLTLSSFRSKIAVISQFPYLFNDTVMNNLLYGNFNKSENEAIELCKKVKLHDTIMLLPKGYHTLVGEQGGKFSGGEKQRISIVRCLLRDPEIVLMDEPTSSLDSENEYNIMDAIEQHRKNRKQTILMVTHRLNLNIYADKIIYLGKNSYKEEGSHSDLLSVPDSKYKRQWEDFISKQ